MAKTLICLPQFWDEPMVRLIPPLPWPMSILRGMGVSKESILTRTSANGVFTYPVQIGLEWNITFLSQTNWGCLTPDGFPDDNYFWMNANSVRIRKDVAVAVVSYGLVSGKSARPRPRSSA